jgi:RNA polymerase sigma factor (TIGR02999 family)
MRRILVDHARRRDSKKQGGDRVHVELHDPPSGKSKDAFELLALDEALSKFQSIDARAAKLVKLRYFGGLTMVEAAGVLGIAPRTAADLWTYARAWLFQELTDEPG